MHSVHTVLHALIDIRHHSSPREQDLASNAHWHGRRVALIPIPMYVPLGKKRDNMANDPPRSLVSHQVFHLSHVSALIPLRHWHASIVRPLRNDLSSPLYVITLHTLFTVFALLLQLTRCHDNVSEAYVRPLCHSLLGEGGAAPPWVRAGDRSGARMGIHERCQRRFNVYAKSQERT